MKPGYILLQIKSITFFLASVNTETFTPLLFQKPLGYLEISWQVLLAQRLY